MIDWLLSSIDPGRSHEVGFAVAWHARLMVFAWGVVSPLAVFVGRFYKITPNQQWPQELDSKIWWRSHWMGQTVVVMLTLLGLGLILGSGSDLGTASVWHRYFGYAVIVFAAHQALSGVFRGSKGGPTDRQADGGLSGDHFDMTRYRLVFEMLHKSVGYMALVCAVAGIVSGLWVSNAPKWMWVIIGLWWFVLTVAAVAFQLNGRAYDTYQAIWGADATLPGNQIEKNRWRVVRPGNMCRWNVKRKDKI